LHSLGAVHSYRGLLICRFFLGAVEGIIHWHEFEPILKASLGGLFPGIVLLFSSFYKRHAMQLRISMMFSVTSLAGAFSGLLAFGIVNLNGKYGIAGWQWIFILVSCPLLILSSTDP
jgi:MFS family permease